MEKRQPSYTVDGNVNRYNSYGKQYEVSSKKLKIELPYDLALQLLVIYPDKTNFKRYMHYIDSTIYNSQGMKTTGEWIKSIYTMEYYSALKKNEIMPFAATWMDLGIIILSEVREKQINM